MKLQRKILFRTLKNSWLWITILIIVSALALIFCAVRPGDIEIIATDFLSLIFYPLVKEYTVFSLLVLIYQIGLHIYLIAKFYAYEFSYSFENIIMRVSSKKWIANKMFFVFIFTVVTRILYILLMFIYFSHNLVFLPEYLLYSVICSLLLSFTVISVINFYKLHHYLIIFLIGLIFVLGFIYFNFYLTILLIFILIILNFEVCNLKKIVEV